jgi:2,3-bisphosphoglycerate-independent phosphoglycerate mutase
MTGFRSDRPGPVVLCILDGWGYREDSVDNAIENGKTPVYDRLMAGCPHALLSTSGIEVGLPDGQMGNSEVGHLNLGAGRIVDQEIRRIDAAIADGSLARNPALVKFIAKLKASGGVCHLMGLISPGGVHSHQDHVAALAKILDGAGIPVALHAFLDGRDTPPQSAMDDLARFNRDIAGLKKFRFATVCGRYFAMDRDSRWDRVERAHDALVSARGNTAPDPEAALRASYDIGETDEFVAPTVIAGYHGMRDGDGVLVANFRADRVREILGALIDPEFDGFARARMVAFAGALGMVEYSDRLNRFHDVLFAASRIGHILGEEISAAGLRQLRIAETEKYAHVTFFFNGGVETPFAGEDRVLVPSPKVATYDLQPEMSAAQVTDKLTAAIGSGDYDFILVNYANPDMVGHTGDLAAATAAIETIDHCLGRLEAAITDHRGTLFITADHGNAETMRNPQTGAPHTAHTLNRVPAILVNAPRSVNGLSDGSLADVAPTILSLLGLAQPPEMTGRSLIQSMQSIGSDTGEHAPA